MGKTFEWTLPKMIHRWQISHEKAENHQSLRKCKLNLQQIPLTPNRIKSQKTVTIPNVGEDVEELELSNVAGRNAK